MTAVNFFSKMRQKRHCLVRRIYTMTTKHKLTSSIIAFPMRPHGIVRTSCRPGLLAAYSRGISLLTGAKISCYVVLSFAPRVTQLSTQRFVSVLGSHCRVRTLMIKCSRHFKRGHDRNFRSCIRCNHRLNVRILLTHTCSCDGRASMARIAIDSSTVHNLLLRKGISRTTRCLKCSFFLSNAIINNCRIKHGVNFPATGLHISSPSGLVPYSNICTIHIYIRNGRCNNVLDVNCQPALRGKPSHDVRIRVFQFSTSVCRRPVHLSFIHHAHPRLGFSDVRRLVTRLRHSRIRVGSVLSLWAWNRIVCPLTILYVFPFRIFIFYVFVMGHIFFVIFQWVFSIFLYRVGGEPFVYVSGGSG